MVKRNRGYKFAAEVADGVENDVLTVAETTHWDPVETAATRPLAFVDHSGDVPVTYFYTHDLTKNICEVLDVSGAIVTAYDYTPFGTVTASNTATPNTVTFSSEVLDVETALVYYNYRHYNPADGRWINRDPIDEQGGMTYREDEKRVAFQQWSNISDVAREKYSIKETLYLFTCNTPCSLSDMNGLDIYLKEGSEGAGVLINALHQKVWACINTPTPQKLDLQCYSFALSGVTFRWSIRRHWLGWSDFVLGGVSAKGEIYRDAPIGDVKKVKKTSPIRDVVWYEKMERRVGTEDIYSVLNYNCRKYSQKEFFYA